ncbi:MAG TPA: cell wall-binding repeat-containing protein [Euzebya sp.]|nr:cell wall-binding repeat-containing protein [Euzebya sp.]
MRIRHLTSSLAVAVVLAVALAGQVAAPPQAGATPIATDDEAYASFQRVFPDPQGCLTEGPGVSPFAEGAVCSTDFIQFQEMVAGIEYLQTIDPEAFGGLYPDGGRPFAEFVELQRLDEDHADALNLEDGDGLSAGLPQNDLSREHSPLYMIKVTDSASDIPESDREHFIFSLSVHGIERAGAEGGIRAAEDLVTWAATDPDRPLVTTDPRRSVTVADALRESVIYFAMPNPDGWVRGDTTEQGVFYQRYNGNGVDLNRDWPAQGFTYRPYTPLSEPESRSFARVLQSINDDWAGGNDLHGQLIDRAFSFTLIGGNQRPFDKNQEAVRVMRRIWADQETRLSWSELIKPNSASPDDPQLYADQWGTIWDTIDYTVTGAMGDWIDSPLGLDGLGLDNEMSLSHLSNCGTGKCYVQEVEQLHVDGNKGLIYAQINLQLQTTSPTFRQPGRTAYVVNPDRVTHEGSDAPGSPEHEDLPPQEDTDGSIIAPGQDSFEFDVQGPDDGVYNGGVSATVTFTNVQGVSPGATTGVVIERQRTDEEPLGEDDWEEVNADYNQSPAYLQGGMTVNVNAPAPGLYRVRLDGAPPGEHAVMVNFTSQLAWPDPGQLPYDVSNTDFLTDLDAHAADGFGFTPVTVEQILGQSPDAALDLAQFDAIVLADTVMPGFREEVSVPTGPEQEPISGSVINGAAGAGTRTPATSAFFEFDVEEANNGSLTATATPTTAGDIDLYLQRQLEDGTYSTDLAQGESGSLTQETLTHTAPQPGHYRLEVHNWAATPGDPVAIDITFAPFEVGDEEPPPSDYTPAERDVYLDHLAGFARDGGNLLLTDGALEALTFLDAPGGDEALLPDGAVDRLLVYAGHVEFTADGGESSTYATQDLAKEINQPGAAEGANHRHQTAEPVPTGYAIQNPSGGDQNSHPNWVVDQAAWEAAGGVTVGTSAATGVSLGEMPYGDGVLRIIGGLLPMPTEEFDHPFGLGAYGVTYSGYQVFDNSLQFVRPGGTWRLAGEERYETAAEVAYHHWNTVENVVIANGEDFTDALIAAPLARALDAPILLTRTEGLPDPIYEYLLTRNPSPTQVYVIGGEGGVGPDVIDDLTRLRIPEGAIVRVGGGDRYDTSVAVAEALESVTGAEATRAVVTTGERFPDALAAGPIAGNLGPDQTPVPLLLTAADELPEQIADYLDARTIERTVVIGGPAAVSEAVVAQLPAAEQVGGLERTETSALAADLLAELREETATEALLATAANFPDALVVGSVGGRDGIPTLLTYSESLAASPPTHGWLVGSGPELRRVYIAGGNAVISHSIAEEVEALTRRSSR